MSENQFKKEIRLFDAVMLVAGTMIGSGIFIVSADISRNVGSAGLLIVVWLLTGLITMAGALSYGELAAMMPKAGGQYVYLREAYGSLMSFLYVWTLFLVIQTGTIAAVAVAFARFTGVLVPFFDEKNVLFQIGTFKLATTQVLAMLTIVFLTFLNTQSVKNGKIIQNLFGSTKIIALVLVIALAFIIGWNPKAIEMNYSNFWKMPSLSWADTMGFISIAMIGSLFSSDAWNNITFAGDEIINPKRTIPMSLAIGTGLVTLIYILVNVAYTVVLPVQGSANGIDAFSRGISYASNDRVAIAVAEALGGVPATIGIALLIIVSTFGSDNGCILSGARVYYAISKDGLFFKKMGTLNKNGVPAWALWGQCIWASLLCLSGTYGQLLDYVMVAVLLFYIFTIAAIFILRKKQPDTPRPYKAFLYPFLPALYIALVSALIISWLFMKEYTIYGIGIVLLGIPVYYLFLKKKV
jgi:basic amino acid/polyamine antiporter, APA family